MLSSVETVGDKAVKSLDFNFFLSDKESVALSWRLKNIGFLMAEAISGAAEVEI